jgi:hypothetical protein
MTLTPEQDCDIHSIIAGIWKISNGKFKHTDIGEMYCKIRDEIIEHPKDAKRYFELAKEIESLVDEIGRIEWTLNDKINDLCLPDEIEDMWKIR